MGASPDNFDGIAEIYKRGMLPKGGLIADLGCTQLRDASERDVARFFATVGVGLDAGEAARLAAHNTFICDHMTRAGFRYRSFDIVDAPSCEYFDLNSDRVPRRWRGAFDLVLNFGTTEHVLNQYNAMRALHDLPKPGGVIYSLFLRGGYMEHGLLHYSDQFINLLCHANRYETVWQSDQNEPGRQCTWIVMRKTSNAPFRPIIDVQVGEEFPRMLGRLGILRKRLRFF